MATIISGIRYQQFNLGGHFLGFSTSGFFPFYRTTLTLYLFFNWTQIPQNFVAIMRTSIRNRSLEAAILDFSLLPSSRLVAQHCHYPH